MDRAHWFIQLLVLGHLMLSSLLVILLFYHVPSWFPCPTLLGLPTLFFPALSLPFLEEGPIPWPTSRVSTRDSSLSSRTAPSLSSPETVARMCVWQLAGKVCVSLCSRTPLCVVVATSVLILRDANGRKVKQHRHLKRRKFTSNHKILNFAFPLSEGCHFSPRPVGWL